jgi:uncharacterized protein YcgI (DUF1989 family)
VRHICKTILKKVVGERKGDSLSDSRNAMRRLRNRYRIMAEKARRHNRRESEFRQQRSARIKQVQSSTIVTKYKYLVFPYAFEGSKMIEERKKILDEIIPPKSSLGFVVKKGQYLRITDVEGKQVGDMAIFNEQNLKEKLSTAYTAEYHRGGDLPRTRWFDICLSVGDKLYSTIWSPMMTLMVDTQVPSGVHDFFGRSCSRYWYSRYGINQDGCLELLANAVSKWGITREEIPDSFNVFMNTRMEGKRWYTEEPVSRRGDYIELRAEMDLVGGITTCPCEITPVNAWRSKPLQIQIFEPSKSVRRYDWELLPKPMDVEIEQIKRMLVHE